MARIRTIKRPISEATRRAVAEKYGCTPGSTLSVRCAYCDSYGVIEWFLSYHRPGVGRVALFNLEFDHSLAESRGGKSSASNIVLACRPCNRSKGAKLREEWRS